MEDYKFLFKVVLVGNAGVGKTCLVRRFTQGMFPPGQGATIGVDFMIKTVEIDGEKIKVRFAIIFVVLRQLCNIKIYTN
jgi:Ras-related protein Rab-1A